MLEGNPPQPTKEERKELQRILKNLKRLNFHVPPERFFSYNMKFPGKGVKFNNNLFPVQDWYYLSFLRSWGAILLEDRDRQDGDWYCKVMIKLPKFEEIYKVYVKDSKKRFYSKIKKI